MKICFAIVCCTLTLGALARAELPAFVRGADLSFVPELEANGAVFRANGEATDPVELFRSNGVNCVRLRLWNDPAAGWNNTSNTLAMAQRVKAAGMALLLDLHYSDSWADPGQQTKPAAWNALHGHDLENAVRNYTTAVITNFAAHNLLPDGVQIGNEITQGFLWNDGRVGGGYDTNWPAFAALLKAAIAGITNSLPPNERVDIVLHIDRGGDWETSRYFFDHITAQQVPFDIIGLSYYPWWHGPLSALSENLAALAARYEQDVLVMETAYPWTLGWADNTHNIVGDPSQLASGFPATPQGQLDFLCAVRNIAAAVPNSRGRGFCYWAPDYIAVNGVGSPWENLTLFDFQTNQLPAAAVFADDAAPCALQISAITIEENAARIELSNIAPGTTATVQFADSPNATTWSNALLTAATNWAPFLSAPIPLPAAQGVLRLSR